MYGSHYSDKPRKVSGDEWEAQTFQLLGKVFPNAEIRKQVRFPELPHAIIDFYVPEAKVTVECKACGLSPVPRNCDDNCSDCNIAQKCELLEQKRRQDILKSQGLKYVWWVDRERPGLVSRTRKYLENVFYNCLDEKSKFIEYLNGLKIKE
jgi:hypothetical protein